jgi:hypothetical protein
MMDWHSVIECQQSGKMLVEVSWGERSQKIGGEQVHPLRLNISGYS